MMIRFIRGYAREQNSLQKTIEVLDRALTWREQNNVNDLLATELKNAEQFHNIWFYEYHGHDREGHPIYYERTGKVDPTDMLTNFTIDEAKAFHVQMLEEITTLKHLQSEQTGKLVYKHTVIMDLEGLGRKHLSKNFYTPIKSMIDIDQYYYPETLWRLYIINAPFIFKMLWSAVKPWIHPITRERIQVLGSDYKQQLLKTIDADQLPVYLGGTCQCADANCVGAQQRQMVREHIERLKQAKQNEQKEEAKEP
eukprot:TRINITY_DN344_c0_g2_i6.p2 TRINITY_DN344_c0_g2~~TRINITY_DN344_c0_g2_i6.p2  ORF type:complete len:253 (-),score=82.20 TRINITY_DN344_c0_g2_i6:605-1363(-)